MVVFLGVFKCVFDDTHWDFEVFFGGSIVGIWCLFIGILRCFWGGFDGFSMGFRGCFLEGFDSNPMVQWDWGCFLAILRCVSWDWV